MIVGMTLHPGEECSRRMQSTEHLVIAALDCRPGRNTGDCNPTACLFIKYGSREQVLCTLEKGVVHQQKLDLIMWKNEQVTFMVEGTATVYLTGYTTRDLVEEMDEIDEGQFTDDQSSFQSTRETVEPEDEVVKQPSINGDFDEGLSTDDHSSPHPTREAVTLENEINEQPRINDDIDDGPATDEHSSSEPTREAVTPENRTNEQLSINDETTPKNTEVAATPPDVKGEIMESDDPNGGDVETTTRADSYRTRSMGEHDADVETRPDSVSNQTRSRAVSAINKRKGGHIKTKKAPTSKDIIQCQHCTRQFYNRCILQRHKLQFHKPHENPKCNVRDTIKGANLSVKKKRPVAQSRTECRFCGKAFKSYSTMLEHEKVHMRERPFQCRFCPKAFKTSSHIKEHERIHTGERPFQCQFCESAFAKSSNLKVHERLHTGERPYQCQLCEKGFSSSNTLKYHARKHTGELPYQCRFCEKMFSSSTSWKYHENVHTGGERPHQCRFCEKKFKELSKQKRHEKIHTREKN